MGYLLSLFSKMTGIVSEISRNIEYRYIVCGEFILNFNETVDRDFILVAETENRIYNLDEFEILGRLYLLLPYIKMLYPSEKLYKKNTAIYVNIDKKLKYF